MSFTINGSIGDIVIGIVLGFALAHVWTYAKRNVGWLR